MQASSPDFASIFYRKIGNGPVLVLLHGFPENGVLWQEVWPALEEHFTLIVPDLPGSGQSSGGESIMIENMAVAVNAILETEGISEAVIAGHSMGGYVALAFAHIYGYKVKGISLVHSTAYADDDEKRANREKVLDLIRKGGKDAFIKQMVPALFSPATKTTRPDTIEKQVLNGLQLAADSMIAYYEAMMVRPDKTLVLKDAPFPVQWILGEDDTVIPLTKGLQQSTLASVNFVTVYKECGHMSMLEQSENLAKDLEEFVRYCNHK